MRRLHSFHQKAKRLQEKRDGELFPFDHLVSSPSYEGAVSHSQSQEFQIMERSEGTKDSGANTETTEKPLQVYSGRKEKSIVLSTDTPMSEALNSDPSPGPCLSQILSTLLNQVLPLTFQLLFVRVLSHVLLVIQFIILYLITVYLPCFVFLLQNCL